MKFWEPTDALTVHKRSLDVMNKQGHMISEPFQTTDPEEFYPLAVSQPDVTLIDEAMYCLEQLWWRAGRPYYNLYPSMLEIFSGFNLDRVPLSTFLNENPQPPVCVRFPESVNDVACVYIGVIHCAENNMVALIANVEYRHRWNKALYEVCGIKDYEHQTLTCYRPLDTVKEVCMGDLKTPDPDHYFQGNRMLPPAIENVILGTLLLGQDPDYFEPVVLNKDAPKYPEASEEDKLRMIEKASKRTGMIGWHVGRMLDTIPHYRRPHPAIRWTGKGRTTAKVVLVRGTMVHRTKATQVPTGYLDDE